LDIDSWKRKQEWFNHWTDMARAHGIEPDYILQRDNVLRTSSKNGSKPVFYKAYRFQWSRKSVSSYHAANLPIPERIIHALYPWPVETFGLGLKTYISDPAGVFDSFERCGHLLRVPQANQPETRQLPEQLQGPSPSHEMFSKSPKTPRPEPCQEVTSL